MPSYKIHLILKKFSNYGTYNLYMYSCHIQLLVASRNWMPSVRSEVTVNGYFKVVICKIYQLIYCYTEYRSNYSFKSVGDSARFSYVSPRSFLSTANNFWLTSHEQMQSTIVLKKTYKRKSEQLTTIHQNCTKNKINKTTCFKRHTSFLSKFQFYANYQQVYLRASLLQPCQLMLHITFNTVRLRSP